MGILRFGKPPFLGMEIQRESISRDCIGNILRESPICMAIYGIEESLQMGVSQNGLIVGNDMGIIMNGIMI